MDILHQWNVDRYGKLDLKSGSQWQDAGDKSLILRILSSRKLVISNGQDDSILETFSLYNSALWLKVYQKGDSLLMLQKINGYTKKYRLRFQNMGPASACEMCSRAVKVLRHYVTVTDVSEELVKKPPILMSTAQPLHGNSSQSSMGEAILGLERLTLPAAYHHSAYPDKDLETLVRLSILDHNFPSFVGSVEKVMDRVVNLNSNNSPKTFE